MGSGTRVLLLPTEQVLSPHCQVMAWHQDRDRTLRAAALGSAPMALSLPLSPAQ